MNVQSQFKNLNVLCTVISLILVSFSALTSSSSESVNSEIKLDSTSPVRKFLVLTVATEKTDGYKRYVRSLSKNGVNYKVLGLGQTWTGGNMNGPGGGQKIRLLKQAVEKYKHDPEQIILFTDAYDVIFNGGEKEVLERYDEFLREYRVVFSAEGFCWPRRDLAVQYPLIKFGKRYLNSGMFIGYAPEIYKLLTVRESKDDDDDQLYYTMVYLDEKLRTELKMGLDTLSNIFQNLQGAEADVEIEFNRQTGRSLVTSFEYKKWKC